MHKLTSEEINTYCENHSSKEPDYLYDLYRQTHLQTQLPVMLSGHLQGRMLSMISHMIRPSLIVEIGTFTGYSALCLAEGLQHDGILYTIDNNAETLELCSEYAVKAKISHKIKILEGAAVDIIPNLPDHIDLVFIDADKKNYELYLQLLIDKVKVGGFILADNVLYQAEVLTPDQASKNGKAMHQYNENINGNERLESVLLPIRDGIMISRKKY